MWGLPTFLCTLKILCIPLWVRSARASAIRLRISLNCSGVGTGLLQNRLHFFNRNYCRIIINSVYLFEASNAFFNSLHSVQPLQGLLAGVISFNIKDHLGCSGILCENDPITRTEKQRQNKK